MERDILLVLSGGAIGILTSSVATLMAHYLTQARLRQQWRREDDLRLRDELTAGAQDLESQIESARHRHSILVDPKGDYCFPAGTSVTLASREQRSVESIRPGDRLLSFDLRRHQYCTTTVERLEDGEVGEIYVLNDTLEVTGRHTIGTSSGWRQVSALQLRDSIQTADGSVIFLTSMALRTGVRKVYCPVTAGAFFANGLLVSTFATKHTETEVVEIDSSGKVVTVGADNLSPNPSLERARKARRSVQER